MSLLSSLISSISASEEASPDQSPESASASASGLPPETIDALLETLVANRWQRLAPEYDDPLALLFSKRVRQWTAGWMPDERALYLLVWDNPSWQEKAEWYLYRNGTLLYQETDGLSKNRSILCHQLLESQQLPFISMTQFLAPLQQFRRPSERPEAEAEALTQTILARPEIFDTLKEPLLALLEADLGNPEWPLLEIMKIHRLAHKIPLLKLFRESVQAGLIRTLEDYATLQQAVSLLQADLQYYGTKCSPLFRPMYESVLAAFEREIAGVTGPISLAGVPTS